MEAVGQVGISLLQQPLQLRQIPVAAVAVADRALERVQQARLALLFFVIQILMLLLHLQQDRQL
jgi:hypothetical protein